jgi:hypothetical protein
VYWLVFCLFEIAINVLMAVIIGAIAFPLANFTASRVGGYIGILVANALAATGINAVSTLIVSTPFQHYTLSLTRNPIICLMVLLHFFFPLSPPCTI